MAVLVTVLLWPLLILLGPEEFISVSRATEAENKAFENDVEESNNLKGLLESLEESEAEFLTETEKSYLERVVIFGDSYITLFSNTADFQEILDTYWNNQIPPANYHSFLSAKRQLELDFDPNLYIRCSRVAPDWYIGFSNEFTKSIGKVDGKK